MKVTIIRIVIGAFGTVIKGLLKGLEDLEARGRVETIQITALWRTASILGRSWRCEETCCHSNFSKRPSAKADVKNYHGVRINNNNVDLARELKKTIGHEDDGDTSYNWSTQNNW